MTNDGQRCEEEAELFALQEQFHPKITQQNTIKSSK